MIGIGRSLYLQINPTQPLLSTVYCDLQTSPWTVYGDQPGVGEGITVLTTVLMTDQFYLLNHLPLLHYHQSEGDSRRPKPCLLPPLRSPSCSDSDTSDAQPLTQFSLPLPLSQFRSFLCPLPLLSILSHTYIFLQTINFEPSTHVTPSLNAWHTFHQDEPVRSANTRYGRPEPPGLPSSPPAALPSTMLHLPADPDARSPSLACFPSKGSPPCGNPSSFSPSSGMLVFFSSHVTLTTMTRQAERAARSEFFQEASLLSWDMYRI